LKPEEIIYLKLLQQLVTDGASTMTYRPGSNNELFYALASCKHDSYASPSRWGYSLLRKWL